MGLPTLRDIVAELEKPGRDPRDGAPEVVFSKGIRSFDDLVPGMELTGTVRNVVDFGAFVDVGVKQDGLVHVSSWPTASSSTRARSWPWATLSPSGSPPSTRTAARSRSPW